MTYYAQRKSILNGVPQANNNRYGTRREMERQFHLYCANACDGEDFPFDTDSIEWGTIEGGMIERKLYTKGVVDSADYKPEEEPEEPAD